MGEFFQVLVSQFQLLLDTPAPVYLSSQFTEPQKGKYAKSGYGHEEQGVDFEIAWSITGGEHGELMKDVKEVSQEEKGNENGEENYQVAQGPIASGLRSSI